MDIRRQGKFVMLAGQVEHEELVRNGGLVGSGGEYGAWVLGHLG